MEEDLELKDGEAPKLPHKLTKAGLEKEDGLKETYKAEGPDELRMASTMPARPQTDLELLRTCPRADFGLLARCPGPATSDKPHGP